MIVNLRAAFRRAEGPLEAGGLINLFRKKGLRITSDELRAGSKSRSPNLEVPQGQLQTAVLGMIVVADRECDIEGVARQKRRFL